METRMLCKIDLLITNHWQQLKIAAWQSDSLAGLLALVTVIGAGIFRPEGRRQAVSFRGVYSAQGPGGTVHRGSAGLPTRLVRYSPRLLPSAHAALVRVAYAPSQRPATSLPNPRISSSSALTKVRASKAA
jgi:hypothetical protein